MSELQIEPGYPVPVDQCISTHGGAGFVPGTRQRPDGKVVCGLCGLVMDPPTHMRVPRWVTGEPDPFPESYTFRDLLSEVYGWLRRRTK